MSRPIEAVVAEAQERLERSGQLDLSAFLRDYPEHEAELKEILPTMLTLHHERRWQRAEAESQTFAVGLFAELQEQPATLGNLFARERTVAGLTLEEQARRSGLPATSLEALSEDRTPIEALDNATIKGLSARVAAPFAALVKEVRRLLSVESLTGMTPGAVFTRHGETSTAEEQQELLDQVRQAARKPPEGE